MFREWFAKICIVVPNSNINKVEPGKIYNCDEPKDIDLVVWTAGIQPVEVVRNLPIRWMRDN